jgi:hypothetical protein
VARFDALTRDPGDDAPPFERPAAAPGVVALVTMQPVRPWAGTSTRLPDRLQLVVDVGSGQRHGEGQPVAVADRGLGAGLAPVYRTTPGQAPLSTARTCIASTLGCDQSITTSRPGPLTAPRPACDDRLLLAIPVTGAGVRDRNGGGVSAPARARRARHARQSNMRIPSRTRVRGRLPCPSDHADRSRTAPAQSLCLRTYHWLPARKRKAIAFNDCRIDIELDQAGTVDHDVG